MGRFRVEPGWPAAAQHVGDDGHTEPARVGHLYVPRHFQLSIVEPSESGGYLEPDFTLHLLFVVDEVGAIRLAGVLSEPIEVPEALGRLRSHGSVDSHKSLALKMLAADDAEEAGSDIGDAIRAAAALPVARRRNRITDQFLREVAEVYRAAWQAGDPPTRAVKDKFGTTHSTAARWVGLARSRNHLGPSDGSRGGERSS
jgi:hypothetical protein